MASNNVKEGTEAGVATQEKNVVVNPLSVDNDKQPKKRKHKSKLASSSNENDDDASKCCSIGARCSKVCNLQVMVVYMLTIFLGLGLFVMVYHTTRYFRYNNSILQTFIILPISLMYIFMFIVYSIGFGRVICDSVFTKTSYIKWQNKEKKKRERESCVLQFRESLNITGRFFLYKLHFSEAMEHALQLYNLMNIYLCTLSDEMNIMIMVLLIAEIVFSIYNVYNMKFSHQRSRQVLVDIAIDIVCMVLPTIGFFMSFPDEVVHPSSFNRIYLNIILLPSIWMILKLRTLLREYYRLSLKHLAGTNVRWSSSKSVGLQLDALPKKVKYIMMGIHALFGVIFLSILLAQSFAKKPDCSKLLTKEIWDGCRRQLFFCQNPFIAKCDCGFLAIRNYSKSNLPETFNELKSLKTLVILGGQLDHLSKKISKHKDLAALVISDTRITELPSDFVALQELQFAYLTNNQLKSLPSEIGEKMKSLHLLFVDKNQLTSLPMDIFKSQALEMLSFNDNYITTLPDEVGEFSPLFHLTMYNNNITKLPKSFMKFKNLHKFYAYNNYVKTLPDNFGDFEKLSKVDIRNNKIGQLPTSINTLKNMKSFYVAKNPLCSDADFAFPKNFDGVKGLCDEQCSSNCHSTSLGNGICDDNEYNFFYAKAFFPNDENVPLPIDDGCNVEECNYDKGDCSMD
jgi:hypothetical protein